MFEPETMLAEPVAAPIDRERFRRLTEQWKAETRFLSSTTAIAEHPAYREIVAMGEAVLPLIFDDLSRNPGQWYSALAILTGENPVAEADRGKIHAMTRAWLEWGVLHGYLTP